MKLTRTVAMLMLLGSSAHGQDMLLPFRSPATRDIEPGGTHYYTLQANAGDLIAGVFDLRGTTGTLVVRDPANTTLKTFVWSEPPTPDEQRVGFVAPASGTYRIHITASGTQKGSYTLRVDSIAASMRLRGSYVESKEVYPSERLRRLAQDIERGQGNAVDQFWREVAGQGPLIESLKGSDQDVVVTFLWRAAYETQNVLVVWPPAWYKTADYYMSHLANTDVWYKTVRVRRGSRFSYKLSPNDRPADRWATSEPDPLNPRRYPEALQPSDTNTSSVLEMPGAPDESWFRRTPAKRGLIERRPFTSAVLNGPRDIWMYTPPGYAPKTGPYPLVILFDGGAYINATWVDAPSTLDNLINARRIRPTVVCFIDTSRTRRADLLFGEAFGEAVATDLLPMLRSSYAISHAPQDVVIGGFSTGALAASYIALRHPDLFGNVLSQSGAYRQRIAGSVEPNSLTRMYLSNNACRFASILSTDCMRRCQVPTSPLTRWRWTRPTPPATVIFEMC